MNPELLKRCLSGTATDAEQEMYLEWINGEDIAADFNDLPVPEQLKNRSWEKILQENKQYDHKHRMRKWMLNTGIAASLFLVAYFSFFTKTTGNRLQHIEVSRYSKSASLTAYSFNGLTVELAKDSQASLKQEQDAAIDLNFSGSVLLKNTDDQDKYIYIQPKKNTDGTHRKVCLQKGRSYVLSYFNDKQEELIVIDNQHMLNIPPALAMNMRQNFNL